MSFNVIVKGIMKTLHLMKCDAVFCGRHVVVLHTDLPPSSHVLMNRDRKVGISETDYMASRTGRRFSLYKLLHFPFT